MKAAASAGVASDGGSAAVGVGRRVPVHLRSVLGPSAKPRKQADFGAYLTRLSNTDSDPVVLEVAINLLTSALAGAGTIGPIQAEWLSHLGAAYLNRFERSGARPDLDRAILSCERALQATGDSPESPLWFTNLAGTLYQRYELDGSTEDLDRAVELQERAISVTPAGHPHLATMSGNLGLFYSSRYELAGIPADLDRAIDCGDQALAIDSSRYFERAKWLANLANYYIARFGRDGQPADIDQAHRADREGSGVGRQRRTEPGRGPRQPGAWCKVTGSLAG